jgi:acyl-CoA thioesterase FadM
MPTAPFVHQESFRWSDADVMGVVNNAVFFTLFEQARYGYFRSLAVMDGDWFPFVLGSTAARFESPGRAGMQVEITARALRLGTKSLDMEFTVRCAGATLATGTATLVWVGRDLRSVAIPAPVRAAIAAREGLAPGS